VNRRGFTLLEVMVATLLMGIAVVGLLASMSTSMHNAGRLTNYDRAAMLARTKMDDLLLNYRLPLDSLMEARFDPSVIGGAEGGWRAKLTAFEMPPDAMPGTPFLERVELEIWWMATDQRRTFQMTAYRRDVVPAREVRP
jgi:general secretion pathway protein I